MGLHEHNARTYGMITNIDANVGRVLAKLGQLGITNNTIVLFLSEILTKLLHHEKGPQEHLFNFLMESIVQFDQMNKAIENYRKSGELEQDPALRQLALEYLVNAYGPDKMNDPDAAEPILQQMITFVGT